MPDEKMPAETKVREASGQRVDWHFFGGRAVIKAIGDLAAVETAMQDIDL